MTAQSDKLLAGHPSENLLARHLSEKLLARHRSEKHVDRHLYDIAIIGGGPVGSALALALKDSRLKICVLEARRANTASIDARALALSYGSRLVLERLGIWGKLQDVSNISTIHISQKQSFGRAVLRAEEMNVPELGYVLPYPALQDALTAALQHTLSPGPSDETTDKTTQFWLRAKAQAIIDSHSTTLANNASQVTGYPTEGRGIRTVYGASVTHLVCESDQAMITYQQDGLEHTLHTRLAVVADGGKLLAGLHPPIVHDYGQSALITHVTCTAPKTGTAFERFTPQGPVALLPYKDGYELVWTAPHQRAQEMLGWDDAQFLYELHQHFGDRVGDFLTVGKRSCFPLGLKKAPEHSPMPHTVLLGNAAQTMHPVAGQGFNMGLRDAWELAQEILDALPENLGTDAMLEGYRSRRRLDREAGIRFTDSLVRLFSNDLPLVSAARAATLTALDCLPFAKKFVAKRMMFGANG